MNNWDISCEFAHLSELSTCVDLISQFTKQGSMLWDESGIRVVNCDKTETSYVVVQILGSKVKEYVFPPGLKPVVMGMNFELFRKMLSLGEKTDQLIIGQSLKQDNVLQIQTIDNDRKSTWYDMNLLDLEHRTLDVNNLGIPNVYQLKCHELKTVVKISNSIKMNKDDRTKVVISSEEGSGNLNLECSGGGGKSKTTLVHGSGGTVIETNKSFELEFGSKALDYVTKLPDSATLKMQLAKGKPMFVEAKIKEIAVVHLYLSPNIQPDE